MDRLSFDLTFMTASALVGGLVMAALFMGHYAWQSLVGAIIMGFMLTWPVAYAISRVLGRGGDGRDRP